MADVILQFDATAHHPARAHLIGSRALTDWLIALGVNPNRCKAFRVFADQTVEVTYYLADGGAHLRCGYEAMTEVHTVPLAVPIPPELDVLRNTEEAP